MHLSRSLFAGLALLSASSAIRAGDAKVPEGFTPLFNGKDLTGWTYNEETKNKEVWGAKDGVLFVAGHGGGWLMTEKEYANYDLRLEFKVSKVANSGVALRAPLKGDPAYAGMEIQIIDDENWKGLKEWQHTASIYNVVPASKIVNKPIGEWNAMHILADGRKVRIEVNGTTVVDANLDDHKASLPKHPGLAREKGHIGFQSHDNRVEFKNVYIKELK